MSVVSTVRSWVWYLLVMLIITFINPSMLHPTVASCFSFRFPLKARQIPRPRVASRRIPIQSIQNWPRSSILRSCCRFRVLHCGGNRSLECTAALEALWGSSTKVGKSAEHVLMLVGVQDRLQKLGVAVMSSDGGGSSPWRVRVVLPSQRIMWPQTSFAVCEPVLAYVSCADLSHSFIRPKNIPHKLTHRSNHKRL